MNWTTARDLLDLGLLIAILWVDYLLLKDSREVKTATMNYWRERAEYYNRRYRAQANAELQPGLENLDNPELPE
jgi:hypothetical protein